MFSALILFCLLHVLYITLYIQYDKPMDKVTKDLFIILECNWRPTHQSTENTDFFYAHYVIRHSRAFVKWTDTTNDLITSKITEIVTMQRYKQEITATLLYRKIQLIRKALPNENFPVKSVKGKNSSLILCSYVNCIYLWLCDLAVSFTPAKTWTNYFSCVKD